MNEYLKKRKELAMIMERYLECLIEKNTDRLPLAGEYRATYNGIEGKVGDNELWHNVLVIQKRQTFLDSETGGIVFVGVASNEVRERRELFPIDDYLTYKCFAFSIRLKVENGFISEIEELAKTGRSRYFFCLPEDIQLPDLMFEIPVPEEERSSREELIEQADLYWRGSFGPEGPDIMHVHPDCQRTENGYQTTNHSNSFRGDFKWNADLKGDTGMHTFIPEKYITYPVLDPTRGIVISYATMVTKLASGATHYFRICEVFLVRDGCIKRILAMFPSLDNDGGWIAE